MRRSVISISILVFIFIVVGCEKKPPKSPHQAAVDDDIDQVQLHQAAASGDIDQVQLLISQGADVNAKDKLRGWTPLHWSAAGGQKDMVELLIAKGSDVNATDKTGYTPLYLAAGLGRREVAELLIAKGADVNARGGRNGWSPLHRAALAGQKDVAELLIAKGSDVNVKDNRGHTPLYNAARSGKKDVGDLLIARGAPVSSLHVAAFAGDLDKIRSFITGGADVNAKDNSGLTPLHFVISDKVAEFLIANGADVNAKSMPGKTALHLAASRGHKDLAELLIDRGADVNAEDNSKITPRSISSTSAMSKEGYGQTALHWAAYYGHKDVVELLIAKGAYINAAPKDGMTALQIAKFREHTEVVELLGKHGAEASTVSRTEAKVTPQSNGPKTDYVAELNKIGIAGRPESDNAAPYYQKAIELYVKESEGLPEGLPEGLNIYTKRWPKELPAQQHALLRRWVQDNSRALEQLQLGSQKPYCWFKYTGETLQKIEMPQLSTIRKLASALRIRAKLQAEDGNIRGATNDIVTLYKFGAHFTDGPKTLVEKLVGIAVKGLSIRTAFNILDKKMVNADMMKSLEDEFKQLVTDYSEPFDIRSEKISLQEQVETDPKYRFFKPYLNSTLEYYDTIAAKTPWQLHNEKTQSIADDNPLIETAGSAMPHVIEIEYRIRADEQALITTLAILRYNANSDAYPMTLQELKSAGHLTEIPKDPFSDKPLVYKRTRDSFTLYSFGADFDDDGGLHSKWGYGDEGGDQVFWPVEQPQMAAGPERPQRRASTYAKSAAQPYPIDDEDEEEYVPVRPRQRQRTPAESIHQAVVDGDIDQVQQLISQGADINSRNRMGWSPLRTAIQNRRQAVVELLIAKGADVSAKDNSGQTPLLVAVNTGQKDTVELLITKGADVNVMGGRGDNALSLAKKGRLPNHPEIVELLLEHGAKEPSLEDMMGDRYDDEGLYPGYEEERMAQRPTRTISPIVQQPVYVDILADPNEIKVRIKTFEGLEKALAEVAGKSESEMRQWQQKRYDNRTLLVRTVQKQFEDEIGFVRKAAVEEKAKKTTEAIDGLLSRRKERLKKVSRELLEQKRAERQTQAPTRGRSRYSGRSTRGRYPQRGQLPGGDMGEPYAERYDTMPGTSRYQGARRPSEQIDRETENEIRLWVQATIDKRAELAKGVHEQIRIDINPIRNVADEEEAKKTTAAIDGLLLYRQMRFEELVKKMEEEQRALQQTQDPRGGRYGDPTVRYPQTGRYRGRTSTRGGTAGQDQYGQQGQQTRRRRR